jgi:hypothetical protein
MVMPDSGSRADVHWAGHSCEHIEVQGIAACDSGRVCVTWSKYMCIPGMHLNPQA